jgi:hypothetical protein
MKRGSSLALTVVCALLVATQVSSQTVLRLDAEINEWGGRSRTLTQGQLIGLARGPLRVAADPDDIRIPIAGVDRPARICVQGRTLDQEYGFDAVVSVPARTAGLYGLRPVGSEWTRRRAIERRYSRMTFPVVVHLVDDCTRVFRTTPAVPVVYDRRSTQVTAVFVTPLVQSGSPLPSVQFEGPGVSGACTGPDERDRQVVANLTCVFNVPASYQGSGRLVIAGRTRTGALQSLAFNVRFP